jgi:hypothetical protein
VQRAPFPHEHQASPVRKAAAGFVWCRLAAWKLWHLESLHAKAALYQLLKQHSLTLTLMVTLSLGLFGSTKP